MDQQMRYLSRDLIFVSTASCCINPYSTPAHMYVLRKHIFCLSETPILQEVNEIVNVFIFKIRTRSFSKICIQKKLNFQYFF